MLSGREIIEAHTGAQFYAGKPTLVEPYRLVWDALDYHMEVVAAGDSLTAIMSSGKCEWRTSIDPSQFMSDVNEALEDACYLGRAANFIPEPER